MILISSILVSKAFFDFFTVLLLSTSSSILENIGGLLEKYDRAYLEQKKVGIYNGMICSKI